MTKEEFILRVRTQFLGVAYEDLNVFEKGIWHDLEMLGYLSCTDLIGTSFSSPIQMVQMTLAAEQEGLEKKAYETTINRKYVICYVKGNDEPYKFQYKWEIP